MAKKRQRTNKQKQRFEKLLERVGQGYLWGRETGNAEAMAFSSGVLMGGLTMLHPDWPDDKLTTEHQSMLADLEKRMDDFRAAGGVTFIYPLEDD